jgi:hypothetical protein
MKFLLRYLSLILILTLPIELHAESSAEVSSTGEVQFVGSDASLLAADGPISASEDLPAPFSFLNEEEDEDDDDDDDDEDDDDDALVDFDFNLDDFDDDYDSPMTSLDDTTQQSDADTLQNNDLDDASDFGVPQSYDMERYDEILAAIEKARGYMQHLVWADDFYQPVQTLCVNKEQECALWSVVGECEANPTYMRTHCAPFCETCEMLHVATRCPKPLPNATLAMYPGDLNRIFHRILEDPAFAQYTPKAVSRPDFADGDTPETADYALGLWVIVLENIVNQTEADHMIELARRRGFERSADVGEQLDDGTFGIDVNDDRTSTNAWCEEGCSEDPVAQKIMHTIEHVTGISERNQESLQQLFYEEGQYYRTHNDFIEYQVDRAGGPRILTFFLYL